MDIFFEKKVDNNVISRNYERKEKYITNLSIRNFIHNKYNCNAKDCEFTITNIKLLTDRDTKIKYREYNKVYTYDVSASNLKYTINHGIWIKEDDRPAIENMDTLDWKKIVVQKSVLSISVFVYDKYVPIFYNKLAVDNKLGVPVKKYSCSMFEYDGLNEDDYKNLYKTCNNIIFSHLQTWFENEKCNKIQRLRCLTYDSIKNVY